MVVKSKSESKPPRTRDARTPGKRARLQLRSQSVQDAYGAEIVFLAVPFPAHKDVAKQFKQWNGKIVVDMTNAFGVSLEQLGGRLSSELVAQAFAGARLVKAFNHLPAAQLVKE